MKKRLLTVFALLGILTAAYFFLFAGTSKVISVLVFSKTAGFRHENIEAGKLALLKMGQEKGFRVDTTEDASVFKEKSLKDYNVIIFLNTTGDILNSAQQLEFNRFIQAGGGFVGIHAAADTEYDWPWYNGLVGAYFESHPLDPNVRDGVVELIDGTHISTQHLPKEWPRSDEWYNYKSIQEHINILLNLDEDSYEGGTNGDNHPIAWYHEYDGGRSFYTGGGHTDEAFEEPEFLQHLWGGIQYAAGEGKLVDFASATVAPEENRFTKVVMDDYLKEPMELELLPDGRIMFVQRGGEVLIHDPAQDSSFLVNELSVHNGHEDGLLGLSLDPNFEGNNWVYLFYSPKGDEAKQHVSRFDFDGEKLDMASEKILLEIPTQREECCHSAGSMEFGPDGLLYIATGDNTNPHASDGFSPADEGEDRSPWDAQKSAGNTMDLRGKILRIKPEADGSYSIPKGNLFDGTEGREEIYVMGCRNPYRISIDKRTGYLYWGEVGPDAGNDSTGRGPMGYDEVNQAREAGFYGWPYFIADNKAYNKYDFVQKVSNPPFKPDNARNTSPNNTGTEKLPEANPAFIWYPYGNSKEFPLVGTGGRNAMAGPVFYANDYPETENRFPAYYDEKLFIYDWMRGWIMAVTMDEDGKYERMEPFLPNMEFNNPIDMMLGPDGDIYMLEYGTKWFSENADARLVHLTFTSGNRPPEAKVIADKNNGALPLTVQFSSEGTIDYDGDAITYAWSFEGEEVQSTEANPAYTFEKPGEYTAKLTVSDPSGLSHEADYRIIAGNTQPELSWEIKGNRSFYWDAGALNYAVSVNDSEDGKLGSGINAEQVAVTIDYLERGYDENMSAIGHQAQSKAAFAFLGKQLVANSDCQACHLQNEQSVGPSYEAVAERYKTDPKAVNYLAEKIINGGSGAWGDIAMAAHPQLSQSEAQQMARYILSLSGRKDLEKGMPVSGRYVLDKHAGKGEEGSYVFIASYTDRGAEGLPNLTSREIIRLRHPKVEAEDFSKNNDIMAFEVEAGMMPGVDESFEIIIGSQNAFAAYQNIDLTGVKSITMTASAISAYLQGGEISLHVDSPDGPEIGRLLVEATIIPDSDPSTVQLKETEGFHDLYLVFHAKDADDNKPVASIDWLYFNNKANPEL